MGQYVEHVTISGDASDYESALAGASAKTKAAATSWASSLTAAGRKMDAVGRRMQTTGRSMTTWLTLPIVGIGVAATKMALDFSMAFKQIQGLAGKTGLSLDVMKQKVLALAGETGQAPLDLANALYKVASASDFAAKNAFPILTMAAKAAEIGMGTVEQAADTLTKTMNAYQGTGLKTANIMNIITAAAKASSTEVSEFATGLGPVTGVAAAMGVSLNDLAAGLAQVVNAGVPFDRAVTGYRFLIQSMATPTGPAIAALKELGLTSEWLFQQLQKPGGMQSALQTISDKAETMGETGRQAFAKIVGGSRGAIVAYNLVGNKAEATTDMVKLMFEAAQDGATNFEDAFKKITTNNPAIAMQKMVAGLKVAAIELGDVLIPVLVEDIIPAVRSAVKWFKGLTDEQKSLYVKLAIGAAVGGPLLMFAGGLVRIGGAALRAIGLLGRLGGVVTAVSTATAAGNVAAGASRGVGALGFYPASAYPRAATGAASTGTAGTAALSPGAIGLAAVSGFAAAAFLAWQNTRDWKNEVDDLVKAFGGQNGALREAETRLRDYNIRAKAFKEGDFGNLNFSGAKSGGTRQSRTDAEAIARFKGEMEMLVRSFDIGSPALELWNKQLAKSGDLTPKQAEKVAILSAALVTFEGSLTRTEKDAIANLIAMGAFEQALRRLKGHVDDASGGLDNLATQEEKAAEKAADQAQKTKILGDRLNDLPDRVSPEVKVEGIKKGISDVQRLRGFLDELNGLSVSPSIIVQVESAIGRLGGFGSRRHSGGPVLGRGDVPIVAKEGEYVINAESARRIGPAALEAMNRYHKGGRVGHHRGTGARQPGITGSDGPTKPTTPDDAGDPTLKPWQRKLLAEYTSRHQSGWAWGPRRTLMRRLIRQANREGVGRRGLEALMSKGFMQSASGPMGGNKLLMAAMASGNIKELSRFAVENKGRNWTEGQSYLFGQFPELQALYMRQLGWSEDRIRVAQQTGFDPGEEGSSSGWYQNWLKGTTPNRKGLSRLTVADNAYGIPTTYSTEALSRMPAGMGGGFSDIGGGSGGSGGGGGIGRGGGGGGVGGSVTIDGLTPSAAGQFAAAVAQGMARVQGSGAASIADQLRALSLEGSLRSGGV